MFYSRFIVFYKDKDRRMRGYAKILFPQTHTLTPLRTHSTLCLQAAVKICADYAHRVCRVVQVVVARLCSVVLPCLQIRVGRFDSGPRLQHIAQLASAVVHFFCLHAPAHSLHTFNATKHLRQVLQKRCVLQNRACRVMQ